ncbi:MAG: hypothetical protein GWN01_14810, partial [Nitrosopumilaceae archaeon]|nr:hypothetical protein [Nitrosopumilaceae archaeon]NIU88510.1 hypothetical protein [Nitrosopumilaceae archaeon]NIX62722.1 hypothetical protein [Nitrosopumilaceae archaeon]
MVWDPRKTLDEIVSGTKKAGGSISEGVRKGDLKKIGRGISEAYKATPMSQGERQLVKSAEKLDPYGDVHEKKRKAEAEAEEAARRAAGRFEDIEAPTG